MEPTAKSSIRTMTRNRFAAIETTNKEPDARPFNEYESRRAKRRRHGTVSPRQQSQQPQQPQQHSLVGQVRRQRGGRLIRGNSASKVHRIAAAKIFTDKAVFCVDNVNPAVSVDDLKSFVNSLQVNVLSCFSARPRRNRGESLPVTDRCAFRLCVAATDRDRLLDSSKWPDSVIISCLLYTSDAADE